MKRIYRLIWDSMTYAERLPYTRNDTVVFGTAPGPIRDTVDSLCNKITNLMGITRRGAAANIYLALADSVSVEYSALPPQDEDTAIQICAPGAPKGIAQLMHERQILPEDLSLARALLGHAMQGNPPRLNHQDAVDLVEFIMTREGKSALLAAVATSDEKVDYKDAYERLHEIAKLSLGSAAYYSTRDSMVISGNSWTSAQRVRQIGGGLPPGTTRADLAFSKWTLLHPPGKPVIE